ncbi:MAG: exosome non-catalytic core subunit rrp46 [Bogoriella megaspora]|nr:MAG: exosome non-catalytic core subunit rrp46 [Bogoriella megaspora]
MTVKDASLSNLEGADGSAQYSQDGFVVIGAVNGPIEVQRRDELPEEAAIEVNVRPAVGVGSPSERHLETLLQSFLRPVILVENFPRTLIQVTLQVLSVPELQYSPLAILPALLQASLLALLSASIPLQTTYTTAAIRLSQAGEVLTISKLKTQTTPGSFHVFAFTSQGDLLLTQSEGSFTIDDWHKAYSVAEERCRGKDLDPDSDMVVDEYGISLQDQVRKSVQDGVEISRRWKKI